MDTIESQSCNLIQGLAPAATTHPTREETPMNRSRGRLAAGLLLCLLLPWAAAAGDDPYQTVRLELSTPDARMAFVPAHLELRVGTRYRLTLVNVGPVAHEFDAPAFVLSVESERVEVFDRAGSRVAVLVGRPEEVELAPGARVDWYLMPLKAMQNADMLCDLPGHLQAGMRGTITVR
jgi:uncharacterized cupredoxin-like copper-binding protein